MFHLPAVKDSLVITYHSIRALLYVLLLSGISIFILQLLFPTFYFSYDFRVSNSRNTLSDPYSEKNISASNGKIVENGTLTTSASVIGAFSLVDINLTLERRSAIPETLKATIKRSYRSFLLPTGTPITGFPEETVYKIEDSYYALRDTTLYPFVSNSAFLSRYPESRALIGTEDLFALYPLSEELIGYRVGSLVSFADGVFIITSETDMRPIGNAETLLSLGYRFEDVVSVSEEEIGIYKRGRIILPGAQHPDGTLLFDQDTNIYYLIDRTFKRPIMDTAYKSFLEEKQIPIIVSSSRNTQPVSCILDPSLFGQSFSCQTSIDTLMPGFGNDFIFSLEGIDTDIELKTLDISFKTRKDKENIFLTLSQIRQRLETRLGNNR